MNLAERQAETRERHQAGKQRRRKAKVRSIPAFRSGICPICLSVVEVTSMGFVVIHRNRSGLSGSACNGTGRREAPRSAGAQVERREAAL